MAAEPRGMHPDRLPVFRVGGCGALTSGQPVRQTGSPMRDDLEAGHHFSTIITLNQKNSAKI